jgi:hypothetical protein
MGSWVVSGTDVEAVCRRVVDRKLSSFRLWPEQGRDDLLQVARLAAVEAVRTWDRSRAALSTWVYVHASRSLIDLWRSLSRRHTRAEEHQREVVRELRSKPVEAGGDGGDELTAWLRGIVRAARAKPERLRTGRPGFPRPVRAGIAALMMRMRLSARGAEQVLAERHDLRRALGVDRAPSYRTCSRCSGLIGRLSSFVTDFSSPCESRGDG